jgi:predicted SAM-dependent methyltransferase
MRRLICAVAGLAILAATPAAASTCIRHDDIWNWSSPNDKTLILEDYRHHKWLAKMIGTCQDLYYHQKLIIKARGSFGISCVQMGDIVITRNNGLNGRCAITSVVPYVAPAKGDKDNMSSPHSGY